MSNEVKQIFTFPDEFPNVTTGILFPDDGILITGHENGYLMKWNIETGKSEKLHECGSTIETISKSPAKDILVGCNSGLLFSFSLSSPKDKDILQEPTFSKFSRVWRSAWPTENNILMTSTYGGFSLFNKKDSGWEITSLRGHSDSIFGIDSQNSKFLASGDYRGHIIVWEFKEGTYHEVDRLRIQGKVEGISWIKDDAFATIDELGHINVFELESETNQWKSVYEADAATSKGISINVTDDGKTIFAGSKTEIIQFDLETQQLQTINLENSREIFSKGNTIYILTEKGLSSFQRTEIEVPVNQVKYQYAKISLIGHTGVGKSTLCSIVVTGSSENIKSTFGRKIWTWIIQQSSDNNPERRVIFHDHGGQQTVLGTFLPFLTDSDIILIFFKQTDQSTFEKAYQILDELKSTTNNRTKFLLVQTYIDHDVNDIDPKRVEFLKNSNQIIDCLMISPTTQEGLDGFKERLVNEISWSSAKTMIQSEYVWGLMQTIAVLQNNDATVVSFNEIKKRYKEIAGLDIPIYHLEFLLKSFSSQGLIEYLSELNSVIFNDENYNKIRSNIPILVDQKNGIISLKEIQDSFVNSPYVNILDKVFLKYNLAIQYEDLRIFPKYLKSGEVKLSEPFKSLLEKTFIQKELYFPFQQVDLTNLIKALTELKLNCIDASKTEGIFAWQTNACVYYTISETGNAIKGRRIKLSYFIGGKKQSMCEKLSNEFLTILARILGSPISD